MFSLSRSLPIALRVYSIESVSHAYNEVVRTHRDTTCGRSTVIRASTRSDDIWDGVIVKTLFRERARGLNSTELTASAWHGLSTHL